MKFYVSAAFLDTSEVVEIAKAADDLGYDGMGIPDHVMTPLTDAFTPDHYERAEASGITGIITMPWMFYSGPQASLAEKIDGMRKFRKDLGLDR